MSAGQVGGIGERLPRPGGIDDNAAGTNADDPGKVLVHDAEATRRRRRFTFGRHIFLRCHQLEAAELLDHHLEELVNMLGRRPLGVFEVRHDEVRYSPPRYELD